MENQDTWSQGSSKSPQRESPHRLGAQRFQGAVGLGGKVESGGKALPSSTDCRSVKQQWVVRGYLSGAGLWRGSQGRLLSQRQTWDETVVLEFLLRSFKCEMSF